MCNSPVVVQFGLQFFLIAVQFNSFGKKMNSIDEISFLESLIRIYNPRITVITLAMENLKFKCYVSVRN